MAAHELDPRPSPAEWEALTEASKHWDTTLRFGLLLVLRHLSAPAAITGVVAGAVAVVLRVRGLL